MRVAVVGIGNTLAGDDGAGIHVVRELRQRWSGGPGVLFYELECDVLGVADLLPGLDRLIFVDAVAGTTPGEIVVTRDAPRAFAPSFHQTDIGSVMRCLAELRLVDPFPDWEIRGITVETPRELHEGLTPPVAAAAAELVEKLLPELRLLARC